MNGEEESVIFCGRGMEPPGEVWAFWFEHEGQRLYGKVNLLEGRISIMVYSAHRPLKGDEL